MKIRAIAFLLTMSGSLSLFSQAPPPLLKDSVRQRAAAAVTAGGYPSLVIGVVAGDRQEILPFGVAGDSPRREAGADTVYEIGSVTKTFTALLLADAVERHEVALEQPVQQLLPGYAIPKSGQRMITLLDLATQSSGLPRLPENLLPKTPANPYADYTADRMKQFLAGYELPRAPGASYEYSNLGFGLLGQALAVHAGSPYEQLVYKRVLAPLGMKDTAIALSPLMAKRFAAGHETSGSPASAWDLGAMEGAGALRSTARDLLLYVKAHVHPSGPLSKALTAVTQARRATDRDEAKIGMAWQIETRQGQTIVWHNGMTGGYASFVGFIAGGDRGVVVLTNISRDVGELGFAALLPEAAARAFPPEKEMTPAALADYAGRYRLAPGFDLVARVDGGELRVAATGQAEVPVYASAADEFFYKVVDAQLSFKRGSDGAINAVVLHQNGRSMPAPRVADEPPAAAPPRQEIKLEAAALQPYIGRYTLAPGFALEVTAEGSQLYVQATAQGRLPVFPSQVDEFFYKVVDAQLSFQRAADGSVEAVVLHQNGQNIKGARQK
jgi:CubicO group peptidase (beta-lactamase class C family)